MSPSTRFAPYFGDTLLAPEATPDDIDAPCARAERHRVAAVCVNPAWAQRCVESLAGSSVAVPAVVGIPLGAGEPAIKAAEAGLAMERGAPELDAVAAIGLLLAGRWREVQRDMAAAIGETKGALVKMIIESALSTPEEIVHACETGRRASTLAFRELGQ
jgi:deoxyribose-phosphate aldolase